MQQYGGYNGGGYGQQQNPYNQNNYGDGGRGYDGQSPPGGRYGGARKCFFRSFHSSLQFSLLIVSST
jgi:hypothetical protein